MNESIKRGSANSYLTHTLQEKGITLIALVITIVILIILAGVTINLVLGENGILVKAKEARTNYVEAAENEKTILQEIVNETDKIISEVESESTSSGGNKEETFLVTGVTLNKTNIEILVGNTETLIATIEPNNAINKKVNWTSSDENIATVNENGVVTGVSSGTTEIIATTEDGEKTASCSVKVRNIENVIPYDETSQIWMIFNKAKELGYVTQHNTLYQSNPTTITAPVTEYGIAYYEFICRNIDQKPGGATPTPASLDYETSIQGAPGTNEWLNIGTPYDVVLDGDFERHLGYLGPKALQNGETRFAARARVSPNTPLIEIEQTSMFNIQIVSQTNFINAALELGIDNAMELIYSAFEK